ncbi:MAG: class I SAM-dependent methyltransferase [Anaerolineae bacterium]|nr:class I SAM-dependent methyltransferase [Anaerolineae bacterium]
MTSPSAEHPYSHSILHATAVAHAPDFEAVVCDYCGSTAAESLGTLPPLDQLPFPMHRLGASALESGGQAIHFVRCRVCGLVYMTPRPTESAIARFYDTVYAASGAADAFESDQHERTNDLLDRTMPYLDGVSTPSLLDIGCGRGQFLVAAQQRGWRVYGSELSAVAARAASDHLGGVPIHHGDFRSMTLDDSLDMVSLLEVLEHLRAPVDYLRAAAGLIRPGGVLLLEVPNVASWEYYAARALRQDYRGFIIEHLYYFTPALMSRLLADLGLEVCHMSSRHATASLPNPLADLRALRPANSGESAGADAASPAGSISPLPPVSLPRKVLRQANNYLMDTISYLSQGPRINPRPAGNTLYVWGRKRSSSPRA